MPAQHNTTQILTVKNQGQNPVRSNVTYAALCNTTLNLETTKEVLQRQKGNKDSYFCSNLKEMRIAMSQYMQFFVLRHKNLT